jgi:hypothetical protein
MQVEIESLPTYRIGLRQGEAIGLEKGEAKKALAVALGLLARGMAPEDIAEITGLPVADILRLRNGTASPPG